MNAVAVTECPICHEESLEPFLTVRDHSISGEEFDLVVCPSCSFVITNNHPDEASIAPYYSSDEYISHSDISKGIVNSLYHLVRRYMLGQKEHIVSRSGSPGTLLDIGAGTGYFAAHMDKAGWKVTGLEPDARARQVAKEHLGVNLQDMDELKNLPTGKFQVVTLWHVLEHVHRPGEMLGRIKELMQDIGLLVIAVPNFTSHDARHYRQFWAAYDVPRHLWHFSPKAMHKLLTRSGFRVTSQKTMPFDAFYVSLLSEKYKRNRLGLLFGGTIGLLSVVFSLFNRNRASSIIYIARKR